MHAHEFRERGAWLETPRKRKFKTLKKGFAHWSFWAQRWESSRMVLVRRKAPATRSRPGEAQFFLPTSGD